MELSFGGAFVDLRHRKPAKNRVFSLATPTEIGNTQAGSGRRCAKQSGFLRKKLEAACDDGCACQSCFPFSVA